MPSGWKVPNYDKLCIEIWRFHCTDGCIQARFCTWHHINPNVWGLAISTNSGNDDFFVWRNSHLFPGVEPSTYRDHTQHFAGKFRPLFSRHIDHNHNFLNTWRNSNLLGVLSHPFIAHPSPYRLRRLLSPRCRGEYFPKNYNLPPWQLWKIIFKAASSLRVFIPSTPPTSFLMGQAISHFKLPLTYACCTCRAGKKTCRTYRRFGHGID